MSKGKISVRRELREPDAFVKTTYTVLDYCKKHLKVISITAVIAVIAGATAIGSFWYSSDRNHKAQLLLNQALTALQNQPAENQAEASQQLSTIITTYKSTSVEPVAGYLYANQQYRAGALPEAADLYQSNDKNVTRQLKDLEQLGIATISFQQNNFDRTISILEQLQTGRSFINEDLYILLGLSYEKSKQPEKAIATYENMIQLLQNSVFKPWAEERLLNLRNPVKS
ncbi:MAG: tetratricopeptide repeat protein [Deltaproteobacteria bacterium]|nr:tetratricopeptide repeat protein [Deltaproteobacteria bacterium]